MEGELANSRLFQTFATWAVGCQGDAGRALTTLPYQHLLAKTRMSEPQTAQLPPATRMPKSGQVLA